MSENSKPKLSIIVLLDEQSPKWVIGCTSGYATQHRYTWLYSTIVIRSHETLKWDITNIKPVLIVT